MTEAAEFQFACPSCAQRNEVTDPMPAALIDHGCVICGAPVSGAHSSRRPG